MSKVRLIGLLTFAQNYAIVGVMSIYLTDGDSVELYFDRTEVCFELDISQSRLAKLIDREIISPSIVMPRMNASYEALPGRPAQWFTVADIEGARSDVDSYTPTGKVRKKYKRKTAAEKEEDQKYKVWVTLKDGTRIDLRAGNQEKWDSWLDDDIEDLPDDPWIEGFYGSLPWQDWSEGIWLLMVRMKFRPSFKGILRKWQRELDNSDKPDEWFIHDLWDKGDMVLCPPLVACRIRV
jgi:hypothetical protein